jgi:tRNA(Ile2) C34 agmatinyltransferase TiaS
MTKQTESELIDDDEPTCPSCGGPMYTQAHWHYWQCDDCGRREDKEPEEP